MTAINSEDRTDELVNHNLWLERNSFRIVLLSTFTALSVVSGYLLAFLPNIEIFTMMIFLSGFILGKRDGLIVGIMSGFIFCFFNPLGASPLPLFSVQLIYYSLVGLLGAILRSFLRTKEFFNPEDDLYVFPILLVFGLLGALMTFCFDITSSLVDSIWLFGTIDAFWFYYTSGLVFTTLHLVGNILVFIFLLPALIQLIYKLLDIPKDY
jgi:hypothetical protein